MLYYHAPDAKKLARDNPNALAGMFGGVQVGGSCQAVGVNTEPTTKHNDTTTN